MSHNRILSDLSADILTFGYSVRFRANGRSMHPTIREGDTITIQPIRHYDVKRGDIILYRHDRGVVAHRIVGIGGREPGVGVVFTLRGDGSCTNDEPVRSEQILGKVIHVERNGHAISIHSTRAKIFTMAWVYVSRVIRRLRRRPLAVTGGRPAQDICMEDLFCGVDSAAQPKGQ